MQTLRARPALVLFILLLALALLTGVVYAVGKSLGYLPGVGIVEQGSPIRVLAEPVSVTRDEITLTVTDAVLTADKTVILFWLENVPWSALSHDENVGGCSGMAELRLPTGEMLQIVEGGGSMGKTRFVYAPIPAEVNEAVFILPCIMSTLPDLAPENWELPLRFIPAPPDMTVVPVIEIAPTPTAVENTPAAQESPLSITKVLEIGDRLILIGEFRTDQTGDNSLPAGAWWQATDMVKMTDGNGDEIYFTFPGEDIELPAPSAPNVEVWAYQVGKNFVPPLTISYPGIYITKIGSPQTFEFEFDAGDAPQPGQRWTLNKEFTVDGYSILLTSISAERDGYTFTFDHATPVNLFAENSHVLGFESVDISGYTPVGGGGGGGSVSLIYENLPVGKLNIKVSVQPLHSLHSKTWQAQWSQESVGNSLYGIVLKVDKFIPLADGYYLIGHTEWTDERVKSVYPAGWNLKAYDAAGREIPLEPADWQEVGEALAPNQWVYRVYGKAFSAPVTLRATQMGVEFADPARLTLDLRPYNFTFSDDRLGPYKTGMIPLDVPGLMATAFKAAYIKEGDMRGFEIGMVADPRLLGLTFGIESGLDTSGMYMVGGGGGSYRDEQSGLLIARILTNAPMTFPLVFAAREAQIGGEWTVTWTPPTADAGAAPFAAPSACVTLETWKQAAGSPPAIPPGVVQTVLISRGALSPEPSLFLSNLDGSNEQALVFGVGSLSPDGQKLVYGNENNRLLVLDIASGQKTALADGMSPFWSPDGSQIAFLRQTDKGLNVFVLNVYKGSPRALTDVTTNPTLAGWVGNGKKLLVVNGLEIQTIEVASGAAQTLLKTKIETYGNVSISPDGLWLAYLDKVPGRMTPGIFLARLDGSEARLLAQFDYWVASSPVFSPDGKWLAISVMNTDLPNTPMTPALVNVETCQVIPLAEVKGEIRQWVP